MARVVIIDDARLIRELLTHAMRREGFEVLSAPGAIEGLGLVRRERPDVVLLDLEMPERDGVACLRDIRADPICGRTAVIMVSASPARDIIVRVAQIGVQGIIIKGEKMGSEIARRIHQIISERHMTIAPATPLAVEPVPGTGGPAKAPVFEKPPAPLPAPKPPEIEARAPASALAGSRAPRAAPRAITEQDDRDSMTSGILQLEGEGVELEKATEALRKLRPLMTRSELLERVLEGTDLRAAKPAVQRVLSLTGSSSASIDTISKAIKQDQALSLKVLKVANSPIYARGERVETVHKAVARIGVAQIRTTVLSLAVVDSFGSTALVGRIKTDWFWEHSIAVGLLAAKIARIRRCKAEQIDAMFTAGLLHDVGRVIYAERLGEEYAAVIDTADALGLPLETVESRLLLVNHADLTDRLLRAWNFSPELINPIALHHLSVGNIRRIAPRMADSVANLALANRLAHALLLGSSGNESLYPIGEFVEFLRISGGDVRDLCDSVPEQTLDMKLQMLSHGATSESTKLEDARNKLGGNVRPLHISVGPDSDCARILVDRLACAALADAPNLAIVRIGHVRERAQLVSMLRAAEQERNVGRLPALVLGAGQGCFFAPGMLGERTVEQAVLPLRLSRLLNSMRTLVAADAHAAAA